MVSILDTRGLTCPLPLLKAKQTLKKLPAEGILRIWVDDSASIADLRLLFKTLKIELVEEASTPEGHYFLVQQKASTC
ncbi:MAG: sulfurtransferase TusA family protein [Gammaproteobacteria bacterium]|nr:sulfurtransferase TusA family protein [Gammaproteobacteria bacterium]